MRFYVAFDNANKAGATGLRLPYGDGETNYTGTDRATLVNARTALDAALRGGSNPASLLRGDLGRYFGPPSRSGGTVSLSIYENPAAVYPAKPADALPLGTVLGTFTVPEATYDAYVNAMATVHSRVLGAQNTRGAPTQFELVNLGYTLRNDDALTFLSWQTGVPGRPVPSQMILNALGVGGPPATQVDVPFTYDASPSVNPAGTTLRVRVFRFTHLRAQSPPAFSLATWLEVGAFSLTIPSPGNQGIAQVRVPLPPHPGGNTSRSSFHLRLEVMQGSTVLYAVDMDEFAGYPYFDLD